MTEKKEERKTIIQNTKLVIIFLLHMFKLLVRKNTALQETLYLPDMVK